MDLIEKSKTEEQREKRKELIISAAIDVFVEKGIENTKITDIAERAQIGVASIYKYFKNKTEIVIEAAITFWNIEINTFSDIFLKNDFKQLNGLARMEQILDILIKMYLNHKGFFRFVEEFDNYVIRKKIPTHRLDLYEKNILNFMPIIIESLESGKKDGSISSNINAELYCMTITHAFISLSQELILRNTILICDDNFEGRAQLELVKDMALTYIKP